MVKAALKKMGGKTEKRREQVVRIKVGLYPLPLYKLNGNHMGPPICICIWELKYGLPMGIFIFSDP